MTDPFEQAVRQAAQGLQTSPGDMPTYHDAWQRGRRRRFVKRSALAAAGALILVAALSVNLGRFPGSGSTDVDDIATGAEAATPVFEPTSVATTSPIETPTTEPQASAGASTIPTPSATVPATATPDETPDETPTVSSGAATPAPAAATSVPTPAVSANPPTPVPTALPTPPIAAETQADADGQGTPPNVQGPEPDDETEPSPTVQAALDPEDSIASGTATQPPDPGSPDEPQVLPEPAFTTAAAADATILGGAARGTPLPCDLDNDGAADASCELLVEYACSGVGDVRPGYTAIDVQGDGTLDTCIAMDVTLCDTTGDGMGDTACIIDLSENPEAGANESAENPDTEG